MPDQPHILELLARHETAVKELYEAFADALPADRDFWTAIAAEEEGHANMLLSLHAKGRGILDPAYARFKPQPVLLSIDFCDEKKAAARAGLVSRVQALAVARELESALLETNFFKVAASAPVPLKPILARLAQETQRHLEVVNAALAESR